MRARAIAHPNVALIKYWGKRPGSGNLPATDSLSITLGALATETTVAFDANLAADRVVINGQEDGEAAARVSAVLDLLRADAGVQSRAVVETRNDFPTGAGLASSASGFAALVVAGAAALGLAPAPERLGEIARIGSGSAPRSLPGGFVLLSASPTGTSCRRIAAPIDWPLRIVIAVTSVDRKATGSREGMLSSQRASPYFGAWVESHAVDLARALAAVQRRDFSALAQVAEHNCLKMHAVMIASDPPLLYWNPATLACIRRVQDLRAQRIPAFFTIDAGPQVKVVCTAEVEDQVATALAATDGVLQVIRSGIGDAAHLA